MNKDNNKTIKSDKNFEDIPEFWNKFREDVVFQEEMLTEEPAPVAAAAPKESVREDVCRLQGRLARLEEQLQKMRVIIGAQRIEEEEQEAETEKTMALCVPAQEKTSLWQSIKRLLRELFSV